MIASFRTGARFATGVVVAAEMRHGEAAATFRAVAEAAAAVAVVMAAAAAAVVVALDVGAFDFHFFAFQHVELD